MRRVGFRIASDSSQELHRIEREYWLQPLTPVVILADSTRDGDITFDAWLTSWGLPQWLGLPSGLGNAPLLHQLDYTPGSRAGSTVEPFDLDPLSGGNDSISLYDLTNGGKGLVTTTSWNRQVANAAPGQSITWTIAPRKPGSFLTLDMGGYTPVATNNTNGTGLAAEGQQGARRSSHGDVGSPGFYAAPFVDMLHGGPETSSQPDPLVSYRRHLFFGGNSEGAGRELWVYDGFNPPRRLSDIWLHRGGSDPRELTVFKDKLFFAATHAYKGRELHMFDLQDPRYYAPHEPAMVSDFVEGRNGSDPRYLVAADLGEAVGPRLFMALQDATGRREVGVVDLVPGGRTSPAFLEDEDRVIPPGLGNYTEPRDLTAWEDRADGAAVVFSASSSATGRELYLLEADKMPVLVADIVIGPGSADPSDFAVVDGWLVFSAQSAASGRELWLWSGGAARASGFATDRPAMAVDIFAGAGSSNPSGVTAFAGSVYFAATGSSVAGEELWVARLVQHPASREWSLRAQQVDDLCPDHSCSSSPRDLTVHFGRLFFSAFDTAHGRELWMTDGQRRPSRVWEACTGTASSNPARMTSYYNRLFFAADDCASGEELHTLYVPPARSHTPQVTSHCAGAAGWDELSPEMCGVRITPEVLSKEARAGALVDHGRFGAAVALDRSAGRVDRAAISVPLGPDARPRLSPMQVAISGAGAFNGSGAVFVVQEDGMLAAGWRHAQTLRPFRGGLDPRRIDPVAASTDEAVGDRFGAALAMRDGVLVAGAPARNASDGTAAVGAAFVWDRFEGDAWVRAVRLEPPAEGVVAGAGFGSSVAVWAVTTFAIGAPAGGPDGRGRVYIFRRRRVGGRTELQQTLAPLPAAALGVTDGSLGCRFGAAISLFNQSLLVGTPGWNASTGSVHVFVRQNESETTWPHVWSLPTVTQQLLVPRTPSRGPGDNFGASVDQDDSFVVVGAPNAAVSQRGAPAGGLTYVYELRATSNGGNEAVGLVLDATLYPDDVEANDHHAKAVAVVSYNRSVRAVADGGGDAPPAHVLSSGLTALDAGDLGGTGVYAFAPASNKDPAISREVDVRWSSWGALRPESAFSGDGFGSALSVSASGAAAIGAPNQDVSSTTGAGAVYITRCRQAPCVGSEYESGSCTVIRNRQCGQCSTQPCPPGFFESDPCTAGRDRQCRKCTTQCPTGSKAIRPCSATADLSCNDTATGEVVVGGALVQRPAPYDPDLVADPLDMEACELLELCQPAPRGQDFVPGSLDRHPVMAPLEVLEKRELVTLFSETNGPDWHRPWTTLLNTDPCISEWPGVRCWPGGGSVRAIRLPKNGLSGVLPRTFGLHLRRLEIVDLSDNFLTGPLPATLGTQTPALRRLDLGNNQLSGTPPQHQWAQLQAIPLLNLNGNLLNSTIPAHL